MLPRKLLILAIILPMAAVVGYKLATPESLSTAGLLGALVFTLCLPLFIRWHHPMLVFSWNAGMCISFLPGAPHLWALLSGISFFFAIMDRLLTKQETFQRVPSLIWPLCLLALVTLITAKLTGGAGFRSLGAESFGGKRYFFVLAAILGFFALIGRRIPKEKGRLYGSLFILSGMTWMASNLIYPFPGLYFLYYIFPAEYAGLQALSDWTSGATIARYVGTGFAGAFLFYFLLVRFGIRGLFDPSKFWRILLFCLVLFIGLLGGFRSILAMCLLVFVLQFFLEGLYRTRLVLVMAVAAVLIVVALFSFAHRLPMSVQRSLSVVPGLDLDPVAKYDAQATLDWRVQMWQFLLPEVPRYFWVGKGYSLNPTELYLMSEAAKRGVAQDVDVTMISGSYHSGPLTLIIPLGVFGAAAFVWFAVASLIALCKNYRYGDPELRLVNTFLLSYFIMRLLYFFFLYGHFAEDLFLFTGVIGLSVSVNGGIASRPGSQPITRSEDKPAGVPALAGPAYQPAAP
jgi:hypothetical protein